MCVCKEGMWVGGWVGGWVVCTCVHMHVLLCSSVLVSVFVGGGR